MVPTLNNDEIKKRMMQGVDINKVYRKRNMSGEASLERKIKRKIGKYMNTSQPKTGLETIDA